MPVTHACLDFGEHGCKLCGARTVQAMDASGSNLEQGSGPVPARALQDAANRCFVDAALAHRQPIRTDELRRRALEPATHACTTVPEPIGAQISQQIANIKRRVDRKSTRLNSSHSQISYAVFCLKKK